MQEGLEKYKYIHIAEKDYYLPTYDCKDKSLIATTIDCKLCVRYNTVSGCDGCVHNRNLFNFEEWDKKNE